MVRTDILALYKEGRLVEIEKKFGNIFLNEPISFDEVKIFEEVKSFLKTSNLEQFYKHAIKVAFENKDFETVLLYIAKKKNIFKKELSSSEHYYYCIATYEEGRLNEYRVGFDQAILFFSQQKNYLYLEKLVAHGEIVNGNSFKIHLAKLYYLCNVGGTDEIVNLALWIIKTSRSRDHSTVNLMSHKDVLQKIEVNLNQAVDRGSSIEVIIKRIHIELAIEECRISEISNLDIIELLICQTDLDAFILAFMAATEQTLNTKIKNIITKWKNSKETILTSWPGLLHQIWEINHNQMAICEIEESFLAYEVLDSKNEFLEWKNKSYKKDKYDNLKWEITGVDEKKSNLDSVIAFIQLGLFDSALEILSDLEINNHTRYLRFEILAHQEKYLDIIAELGSIQEQLPLDLLYQLAVAYFKLGKKVIAKKIFMKIMSINPDYRLSREYFRSA